MKISSFNSSICRCLRFGNFSTTAVIMSARISSLSKLISVIELFLASLIPFQFRLSTYFFALQNLQFRHSKNDFQPFRLQSSYDQRYQTFNLRLQEVVHDRKDGNSATTFVTYKTLSLKLTLSDKVASKTFSNPALSYLKTSS